MYSVLVFDSSVIFSHCCHRFDAQWIFQWIAMDSEVDHEKQEIVVKTSNKKYYKRIGILVILVLKEASIREVSLVKI